MFLFKDKQNSIADSYQFQQNLIRGAKARRQSDGVTIVGGGPMICQCCCCVASLKQNSISKKYELRSIFKKFSASFSLLQNGVIPLEIKTGFPLINQQSIPQSSTNPELQAVIEAHQQLRQQQLVQRQVVGIIDETNNSGLLMFANAAIHGNIQTAGYGLQHSLNHTFCHEPLPAFDSQLSQVNHFGI
uniref:Uncharacterized protein n=1 Tax=Meloidogyne hapla TaxID=6305 RepID=A0A1I8C1D7_MELHA